MPSVPMAMPSLIVGVRRRSGVAARLLDALDAASRPTYAGPELRGVMVLADADHI